MLLLLCNPPFTRMACLVTCINKIAPVVGCILFHFILAYIEIHVHTRVTRPTRYNKIVADLYSPCIVLNTSKFLQVNTFLVELVRSGIALWFLHAQAVFTYSYAPWYFHSFLSSSLYSKLVNLPNAHSIHQSIISTKGSSYRIQGCRYTMLEDQSECLYLSSSMESYNKFGSM